jgi:hypothetical protein
MFGVTLNEIKRKLTSHIKQLLKCIFLQISFQLILLNFIRTVNLQCARNVYIILHHLYDVSNSPETSERRNRRMIDCCICFSEPRMEANACPEAKPHSRDRALIGNGFTRRGKPWRLPIRSISPLLCCIRWQIIEKHLCSYQ